jgi:peptide-methionine (S)-S-oxide reductase
MKKQFSIAPIVLLLIFSCAQQPKANNTPAKDSANTSMAKTEMVADVYPDIHVNDTAYFAAGCFWCEEGIFQDLKGVGDVISGYAGGTEKNPSYELVSSHTTKYAESVKVPYDSTIISYKDLLKVYFGSQDPTQVNAQGPDEGYSYRSVVWYRNNREKMLAQQFKDSLNASKKYSRPIAVSIEPKSTFYSAEDYHQNYVRTHPNVSYVMMVSIPRIHEMEKDFPQYLKTTIDAEIKKYSGGGSSK